MTVSIVDPQLIYLTVVGDVEIYRAITRQVSADDAQTFAGHGDTKHQS